jgi:hypothetical protein
MEFKPGNIVRISKPDSKLAASCELWLVARDSNFEMTGYIRLLPLIITSQELRIFGSFSYRPDQLELVKGELSPLEKIIYGV